MENRRVERRPGCTTHTGGCQDLGRSPSSRKRRRVDSEAANCSQHIPQRFEAADVEAALAERDRRIAVLEAEMKRLR
jgi:hypothetical protein